MLKSLRKHSRSWFIALAIGAIVVVFIFWGVGTMKSPAFQEAAEVNGTPILMTAYLRQFNELAKQYQERTRGELTEETIKALRLKEMALSRLVDETLLLKAGERLGFSVSDADLRETIRSYPFFQKDGKFDESRYKWLLARNRISPADFEQQERRRLLLLKVVSEVGSFAKVSDLELEEYYRMGKEQVEVRFLEVPSGRFLAKQNPADAEVARYYQDHQDIFREPARSRVKYLVFSTKETLNRVKVSSAEIISYLKENPEEFSRAKVIQVRQLLLRLPPNAAPAEKQAVEKQSQELLAKAMQGEDFAELARAHSQDAATKNQGGEEGEVSRGRHPPEWDNVAFALKPGTVGRAVTPQGIFLIKVEAVKETERLPDAEAQVEKLLKADRAKIMAREAAQQAREEWSKSESPEAAGKYGLTPQETPLLARQDAVPGLGVLPNFNLAALDLKPKGLSKVVELPDGFAVLKGVEHRPENVPPLEQIKDQVRQALKKSLAKSLAEKEAAGLLEQIRQGKPLAQVAAQAGLSVKDSGYFTRFQGFLGHPSEEQVTAAAFQLSGQQPYPSRPLPLKDSYYIFAFKARKTPDQAEIQKEADKLREGFLEQKRQVIFASWLDGERKRAKIKIFELP